MKKPDWKDSPEGMRWLAQDRDGCWWWYADKPVIAGEGWCPTSTALGNNKLACNGLRNSDWKKTLEPRPSLQEQH